MSFRIKTFFMTCLLISFMTGCISSTNREKILLQSQQIKASTAPLSAPSQDQKQPTLPTPEKLVYKAKYLGITIGDFIIVNKGITPFNNREAYCFEITVKTLPFFGKAFNTKDRYISYMDAKKLVVLRHEEYIKEGAVLESAVDFNYETHIAHYKNFITKKEVETKIPDKVLDVFTGGFYLRMVPWELGDTVEFPIYADEKIYNYIGLLHSKTTINFPPHGKKEVYLLKPYAFLDGKQITQASADVYFTTTSSRKTLRAVLKTIIGNVSVALVEGSGF